MSVTHYEGIMENLMFIQQMYFKFRMRVTKKRSHSYAEKMETHRKSNVILRIMNEIDLKLYEQQKYTGFLESGTIEIYRLSRKGYLRVFDIVNVGGAVKGLESKRYTSRLRKDIVQYVKSRYVKVKTSAPANGRPTHDEQGNEIFYYTESYIGFPE